MSGQTPLIKMPETIVVTALQLWAIVIVFLSINYYNPLLINLFIALTASS